MEALTPAGRSDHGPPDPVDDSALVALALGGRNPPVSMPSLRPISDDLLAVIAYQQVELDAFLVSCNRTPHGQRRVFTTDQLRQGHSLGPTAKFTDPDTLVVRLDW